MDGEVRKEDDNGKGRYVLPLSDGQEAELTFVSGGPGHMIIDYSFVPPAYRGRGVALHMIRTAVEDARRTGAKISPVCGYVAAEFRRHRDWADVLKG